MLKSWILAAALAGVAQAGTPAGHAPLERFEFTQVHMGLPVRIVLHAAGEVEARAAAHAAFARIAELDRMMSDYRDDSEVRAVERAAGSWTPVSADLLSVLSRARELAELTGGAFDPTVGPAVALWREARRTGRLPRPSELERARELTGWRGLAIDAAASAVRLTRPGMRIDLGGIAKGYILQRARDTLAAHGITHALVEAGGDIVVGDAPPGRAGWDVETAGTPPAFAARARTLRHAALATSGPSAQFVEIDGVRYSHVVDPRSGMPLTSGWTAMVVAGDGATADAIATALTALGPEASRDMLARFPEVMASVLRAK
jgi:FAD:protein FMN transferase